MNRDEGSYQLSHVWDKVLHTDDRHRKSFLMKASDDKQYVIFGCIRVINTVFVST